MESYTKQSISIENQLEMLERRGLQFNDRQMAMEQLKVISYFRLSIYWRPLESDKVCHLFKPESKFENVLNLYNFDKDLRCLVFSALQDIEIAFRTRIIQDVSSRYGPFWYVDSRIFSNRDVFAHCLNSLDNEIKRSKEEFIVDYYKKYDNPPYPPAWKALEVSSFGTLSKLYCNIADNRLKKQIALSFGLPQHKYFESWIKSLSVLRNYIAHHARIWNRKFPMIPQLPKYLDRAWIKEPVLHEKLYAQLCCMAYILDTIHTGNRFKSKIKKLLVEYNTVDKAALGFTANWESEPLWRK